MQIFYEDEIKANYKTILQFFSYYFLKLIIIRPKPTEVEDKVYVRSLWLSASSVRLHRATVDSAPVARQTLGSGKKLQFHFNGNQLWLRENIPAQK